MKLRIKGNTVRYRLSRNEVAVLIENGTLKEQTEFMNGTLFYAIQQTERADLSANFSQNLITLYVPKAALQHWADSEEVGIEGSLSLPTGNTVYLLLEKDFKCVNPDVKEDQSDYFENPKLTC